MSFYHSIKFRFTVWYLLVLAVLLASVSVGVYLNVSHSLRNDLDNSLELRASELQGMRGIAASIEQGVFQEELGEVVLVYFVSDEGLITLQTRGVGIEAGSVFVTQALAGGSPFMTDRTDDGREMRLHAVPLFPEVSFFGYGRPPRMMSGMAPGQQPPAALVVGRSTEDIEDSLDSLMWTLIIVAPLALVVAGGGGVFLANRALKPVDHIARTALQIEQSGNLSQRITVKTRDELGRLSSNLNRMIERLEHAFNRQKEFTADASHELRAPLAVIQAESTLTLAKDRTVGEYKSSLETIAREASNMALLVDQLLMLARGDADGDEAVFERIDLGELLTDVSADARMLSRDKGIELNFGRMQNLMVMGDHSKLKRLFLNLLDNAIRYTAGNGVITVSLERDGKMAKASISDTGMGISPEHIPHLFDRFYRVDKVRSRAEGGSGLGLAICRQIVEAHGGSIKVESEPGKGSTFSVFLPLS